MMVFVVGVFHSFRYDYDLIKRIICVAAYVVCCKYEHFAIVISVRVSPYRCPSVFQSGWSAGCDRLQVDIIRGV